MERFIDLAKLPVFLENAARGKYKVHLDPGFNGSDSELKFNFAYRARPRNPEMVRQSRFPPRPGARHRSRPGQRGVLPRPRRDRHADPGRHHSGKPGQGLPSALGDAGRRQGQCDAGCDRPEEEGRRGFPAAHRQWRAPAAADRRRANAVADLAAAGRNDHPAMARDRHLGRHAAVRAQPVLYARAQRPEPDRAVEQQRFGEHVSLYDTGAADRSAVELWRRRLCAMVRQQRRDRHQADRSGVAEGF